MLMVAFSKGTQQHFVPTIAIEALVIILIPYLFYSNFDFAGRSGKLYIRCQAKVFGLTFFFPY